MVEGSRHGVLPFSNIVATDGNSVTEHPVRYRSQHGQRRQAFPRLLRTIHESKRYTKIIFAFATKISARDPRGLELCT